MRDRSSTIPARTAIEERLARFESRLSPNRRSLLQATLENPDETFFLSSRALARRYKVDPATIVRTIQALGYERYTDFAADLRAHFVSRLTPYRILQATKPQVVRTLLFASADYLLPPGRGPPSVVSSSTVVG